MLCMWMILVGIGELLFEHGEPQRVAVLQKETSSGRIRQKEKHVLFLIIFATQPSNVPGSERHQVKGKLREVSYTP